MNARTVADMIEAVEEVAAPTGAARLLAASPALARTVHGSRSYADAVDTLAAQLYEEDEYR